MENSLEEPEGYPSQGYENGLEDDESEPNYMEDERYETTGVDDLMMDQSEEGDGDVVDDDDDETRLEMDDSFVIETGEEGDMEVDQDQDDDSQDEVYNCEVCNSAFANLDELYDHYETHDAAEYAFSNKIQNSEDDVSLKRKWPSRFLKFPSTVFENLTKSIDSKSKADNMLNGDVEDRLKFQVRRPGSSLMKKKKKYIYRCQHCGKEFQRSDHFRQHVANHTGSKPFVCKLCGKRFSVIITLRRHMGTHEAYKPFKCSKCPRRFNQSGHLKRHEESPFTHTQPYLQKDYRRRCRLCFEMFPNDNTRLEHEHRVHRTNIPTTILRCRYPTCRLIKPTLKLLVEHYKKQHSVIRSNQFQQQQPHQYQRLEGEIDPNELVIDESTSNPPSFSTTPTGGGPLREECRMCFEYFGTLSERNVHEHRVHDINNPGTKLQCKYPDCRKILGAKNWLARHIREHRKAIEVGEEPQFAQNGNEQEYHQQIPTYECRVCDENFPGTRERYAHEQFYHESRNPEAQFDCKQCSLPVGNFGRLISHIREEHREAYMAVQMPQLQQMPPPQQTTPPFASSVPLSQKQASPNMIFTCRHCDIQFTDQTVRLNHEYEAHNTRDALDDFFPCKICKKEMTLRGLRKHLRRIHKQVPIASNEEVGEDDTAEREEIPPPPPPIKITIPKQKQRTSLKQLTNSASKPQQSKQSHPPSKQPTPSSNVIYKRTVEPSNSTWVCRLCFEHFDETRQRETHEHNVHGTNSPNATYLCKYKGCNLEFSTFRALIKHLRSHGETSVPTQQQKLPVATTTSYKQPTLHNDDGLFKCRLCWEVFPSREHRSSHESHSHQIGTTSDTLPCKFCKYPALTLGQLIKHLESHGEKGQHDLNEAGTSGQGENPDDNPPPQLIPQVKRVNKPLVCRICDEIFPHAKARINHEAKVHQSRNNRIEQKCKECGISVGNFRKLLTHIENNHKKKPQ